MKFTFIFLFATALLVHGIQAQVVFNFLSTLFTDITGIMALTSGNKQAPTGNMRVWIQSGYGDDSIFPYVTLFGKNKNKLGDSKKCSGDQKLPLGKGKYAACNIPIDEAPYYLKFFASPYGNLALSNMVATYNSGGGSNDDIYTILLTGDNVNYCTSKYPSNDGTELSYGKADYVNKGGAWFVNAFNDKKQTYPTTIMINLSQFSKRAKTGRPNCDLMKIQYQQECRQGDSHACFSDKFP